MANINDRIKNIGEFFVAMQVENIDNQNIIYVIVKLPQKWKIDIEETQKKYNVQTVPDDSMPGKYYFIAEMEVGFDKIFDAIEYNIEKMKAIAERGSLFKAKVLELQELFNNQTIPIESLRKLEFKYKIYKKPMPNIKKETNMEESEEKTEDYEQSNVDESNNEQ